MKILYFILNSRFKWTTIQHFALSAVWGLFTLGDTPCCPCSDSLPCQTSPNLSPLSGKVQEQGFWTEFLANWVTHPLLWWVSLLRLWWSPEWSAECGWGSWPSCDLAGGRSPHTFGWLQDTRLTEESTVGAGDLCRPKQKQVLSTAALLQSYTHTGAVDRKVRGWMGRNLAKLWGHQRENQSQVVGYYWLKR